MMVDESVVVKGSRDPMRGGFISIISSDGVLEKIIEVPEVISSLAVTEDGEMFLLGCWQNTYVSKLDRDELLE